MTFWGMYMIKPISFDVFPLMPNGVLGIITMLIVLMISGLSALIIARCSAERYKSDKKKTEIIMIMITLIMSTVFLYFFGCAAITIKGIILCLILLYSSYQDIKTRECDDFVHVMILIAAFIGLNTGFIPGMVLSAGFVMGVMLLTILLTNSDIGGADIKLSAACAFLLGLRRGIIGLLIGLVIAVIVNIFKNKKTGFPMIPYLAVGFMTAYFI